MHALLPAWPLLFWSGLAATAISVLMLGTLLPDAGARALAPFAERAPLLQGLLLGIFIYPLLYAVPFQLLHSATVLGGALIGTVHALLLALPRVSGAAPGRTARAQRAATVVLYGAVLGFIYLTP